MKTKDSYCSDGIISHGERIVKKGGKVLFGGHIAYHEKLIELVGQKVFVSVECYWFLNVIIADSDDYTKIICIAPVEVRKKK